MTHTHADTHRNTERLTQLTQLTHRLRSIYFFAIVFCAQALGYGLHIVMVLSSRHPGRWLGSPCPKSAVIPGRLLGSPCLWAAPGLLSPRARTTSRIRLHSGILGRCGRVPSSVFRICLCGTTGPTTSPPSSRLVTLRRVTPSAMR